MKIGQSSVLVLLLVTIISMIGSEASNSKVLEQENQGDKHNVTTEINLKSIIQFAPEKLIYTLVKHAPNTPESIEQNLQRFHQDLQIDSLASSIPSTNKLPHQLAGLLVELATWAQIWAQVGDFVWSHMDENFRDKVREQFWDQVGTELGIDIWDRIWIQIDPKIWAKTWDKVGPEIGKMLNSKIGNQLNTALKGFNFQSAYDEGKLNMALKPAIKYAFLIYQTQAVTLRHTGALNDLHDEIAASISANMSQKKMTSQLKAIDLPISPAGNFLVNTQLKLVKKIIQ